MKKFFKFLSLAVITNLLLSANAIADDHNHTPDYCSVKNVEVCAHLGHMQNLTTPEAQFVVDVSRSLGGSAHSLSVHMSFKTESDESSVVHPAEVKEFAKNHFLVSGFSLPTNGRWMVELNFKIENEDYQIIIPLEVN